MLCENCDRPINVSTRNSSKTLAYILTALVLYFPANFFPFMTMEIYGRRSSPTIWGGIESLIDSGSWFIAIIIFLASIVIPFLKLAVLFYLTLSGESSNSNLKPILFKSVETLGRWSMLDIFLLAVLVAVMKLGPWTSVEPEIGSIMFALVVVFTMLATSSFEARLVRGKKHAAT